MNNEEKKQKEKSETSDSETTKELPQPFGIVADPWVLFQPVTDSLFEVWIKSAEGDLAVVLRKEFIDSFSELQMQQSDLENFRKLFYSYKKRLEKTFKYELWRRLINPYLLQYHQDMEVFKTNRSSLETWYTKTKQIEPHLKALEKKIEEISKPYFEQIEKFAKVDEQNNKFWEGRKNGISLIVNKMLNRALIAYKEIKRKAILIYNDVEYKKLETRNYNEIFLSVADYGTLLKKQSIGKDEEYLQGAAKHAEKKLGDSNHRILGNLRDAVSSLQKAFYNYFNRNIFDIIDGLDNGLIFFENRHIEGEASAWSNVYKDLTSAFIEFLYNCGIEQIPVICGKTIDYNLHEPFDSEENSKYKDEVIIRETRRGFRYKENNSILRTAQVVVVKNS